MDPVKLTNRFGRPDRQRPPSVTGPRQRTPRAPRSWRRHFDGWQLGLVTIAMGVLAALLVMRHPAPPDVLPLPVVDPAVLEQLHSDQRARALSAYIAPLPRSVRAAGEAFRQLGKAEFHGVASADEVARFRRWVEVVLKTGGAMDASSGGETPPAGRRTGSAALLALRAVQTELFLSSLRRHEVTHAVGDELEQLGGSFLRQAEQSGWMGSSLRLDESELATLFRLRWANLAGLLERHPFAPRLDEWRLYYRLLLRAPEGSVAEPAACVHRQLSYVAALQRRDPTYPADFARGVLHYRRQDVAAAEAAFRGYLSDPSHTRWRWRARNHWWALRRQLAEGSGDPAFGGRRAP